MAEVFAVTYEENDSYDIGPHTATIALFASLGVAERVAAELFGKQIGPHSSRRFSESHDLDVQEVIVYG